MIKVVLIVAISFIMRMMAPTTMLRMIRTTVTVVMVTYKDDGVGYAAAGVDADDGDVEDDGVDHV